MSKGCRSTLCGHPLPTLMHNCTHDAPASRHTIAPISHTRPSPRSRSYYLFPVPLRVGGWVGWAHSRLATCSRLLAVDRVWVEPATSWLRVRYSTNWTTGLRFCCHHLSFTFSFTFWFVFMYFTISDSYSQLQLPVSEIVHIEKRVSSDANIFCYIIALLWI